MDATLTSNAAFANFILYLLASASDMKRSGSPSPIFCILPLIVIRRVRLSTLLAQEPPPRRCAPGCTNPARATSFVYTMCRALPALWYPHHCGRRLARVRSTPAGPAFETSGSRTGALPNDNPAKDVD